MKQYKLRNIRQSKRWRKKYIKQRSLHKEIVKNASDILQSENFTNTKYHIQHGNMTVNSHCINVAKYSLAISKKLEKIGIKCSNAELVRGALLHDYFLYDWHDKNHVQPYKLHGFYHPGIALKNAQKEYTLTSREKDIIRKHMWPLTCIPPVYKEAWIVTAADKWCSLMETMHLHKGHGSCRVRTDY